jgi:acyl-CoA thioester hydrolase
LTLFSEADVPFESTGPGAIRGLYFFMDASSHRLNSRPAFRRFECTRERAKAIRALRAQGQIGLRRLAILEASVLIHALAVQRPNESNPLGFCCDIVKPVFSGIVYHANYLRFMERGRTNHLRLMGAEQHALFAEAQTETPGFAFVVRSMKLDFLKPARMDDVLDIVTWPVAVKGASITLAQEVRRGADVLITAEVRVAFISEGRAQPIPKSLRVLMKADLE